MNTDEVLRRLILELDVVLVRVRDDATNTMLPQEQYAKKCGVIEGLKMAIKSTTEIRRDYMNDRLDSRKAA